MPPFSNRLSHVSLLALVFYLSIHISEAGSATWNLNPTSNDWNTATNWTPETVPDSTADTATFGVSNATHVVMSRYTDIGEILFRVGANSYQIDAFGEIGELGVQNLSGVTQDVDISRGMVFAGGAGYNMSYTLNGRTDKQVVSAFIFSASSGDSTTYEVNGAPAGGYGGRLVFLGSSRVASSLIFANGPAGGEMGAEIDFLNFAAANAGTITVSKGAVVEFQDHITADAATFICNGGMLEFQFDSNGGTCRLELNDGALLNIAHHTGGLSIGSVEGDSGTVQLGSHALTIGANRVSGRYSGMITQSGSIVKVGRETLTLAGTNTYTGGTSIKKGTLLVDNAKGSATGTGPVQVNGGTFGGRSNITGAVTIGSGSGTGAFLAPGINGPGTLVIRNALTFKSDGTYNCDLSLSKSKADQIVCKGVTIESGAQLALNAQGNQTLANGTVFTVLENKTRQHISGTFANLPDHSTFSANGNTFQVNYEGGDGNDLTLTVVP